MTGRWVGSLGLTLGLLATGAAAQELHWHAAPSRPGAPAPAGAAAPGRPPAASLGRPVALAPPGAPAPVRLANPDAQVLPAAFSSATGTRPPSLARDPGLDFAAAAPAPAVAAALAVPNPVALATPRPALRAQGPDLPSPLPPGPPSALDPGLAASPQQGQPPAPATGDTAPAPRKVPSGPPPPEVNGFPLVGEAPPGGPCWGCGDGVCGPAGLCGDPCGGAEVCCAPGCCFYLSPEYLLWWTKGSQSPALVTTGPADSLGVLGQPGTTVLFGHLPVYTEARSGGRFSGGFWFDPCQQTALEGSYFFLAENSSNFGTESAGLPLLARPFLNALTGLEASQLVAFPGALSGSIAVTATSRLWGTDVNLRRHLWTGCCWRVDVLGGFRYLDLDEGLQITESLVASPTLPILGGSRFIVSDRFATRNEFYGGQVGARCQYTWGRWSVDVLSKIALGTTRQAVDISGNTLFTPAGGGTSAFTGGLLAQPSNIGHFSRDIFTVVPEIGVNLGYQVTPRVRAFVGYTFLYSSSVVRPGEQIDRVVNVTQIPRVSLGDQATITGPARPVFRFRDADFWAQGINFGLECKF